MNETDIHNKDLALTYFEIEAEVIVKAHFISEDRVSKLQSYIIKK